MLLRGVCVSSCSLFISSMARTCPLPASTLTSFLPHLVVALIIAMSLWSKDSIEDVLKNLVHGLSAQWIRLSQRWKNPSKSSISEARQRIGPQVMSRLFHLVVRPLGTEQTNGVFLNGLRLMAFDGTAFDLPNTEANARVFGYPGTRPGTEASFPLAPKSYLSC